MRGQRSWSHPFPCAKVCLNSPLCLLFGLQPPVLSFSFQSTLLFFLLLSLFHVWYLLPQSVIDPQRFLQTEATSYAGHPATQRATHGEQPAPGLGHGLQAHLAEGVPAVEHPGDPVHARVGEEADATLTVLTQNHGEAELTQLRVKMMIIWVL